LRNIYLSKVRLRMSKGLIWLGPVTVLVFVVILAVMYGWVDTVGNIGPDKDEMPDMNLTNQVRAQAQPDNLAHVQALQPGQGGRVVHHGRFPAGIGNNQIQLIHKPTFPAGVGNGQIQLINKPTFPAGIGKGQIRLINQTGPGRPYLGLSLGEVNVAVAKELKLPPRTGVYVNAAVDMSPAQKAGLKTGDVLLKCGHKAVNNPQGVGQILGKKKAGDIIKVVVNRNGRRKSFHVKLENAPMGLNVGATQNPVWMGADIQDIDAVMKIRFNLPDNRGVIVSHVARNSPALAAGLRTGDVIRRFEGRRVRDVKKLQSMILDGQPGQKVQLTLLRGGRPWTLEVILGQKSLSTAQGVPFISPADVAIEGSWIGMDVVEVSAGDASDLGLPAGTRGILVSDVESPPATTVGFQTGDVIVAVNGHPTQDMKQFETGTKKQSGAVVDVIRGNRHRFISVPPPGFTQQGTKLNTALDNKMRQVAMARPMRGRLAIFASGPDLNSYVGGNTRNDPYLILVDFHKGSYAVMGPNPMNTLPEVFQQYNVTELICSDISPDTANVLAAQGVMIYTGVGGTAMDAIGLYEANQLVAMKGF
jgi:serine protease Do